jgi:hypothetical protein
MRPTKNANELLPGANCKLAIVFHSMISPSLCVLTAVIKGTILKLVLRGSGAISIRILLKVKQAVSKFQALVGKTIAEIALGM